MNWLPCFEGKNTWVYVYLTQMERNFILGFQQYFIACDNLSEREITKDLTLGSVYVMNATFEDFILESLDS